MNVRWAHEDPSAKNAKPGEKDRDQIRAATALAAANPALQAYAKVGTTMVEHAIDINKNKIFILKHYIFYKFL